MNGRTARKIVWKNRSSYLFGERSFVTVSLPVSIYPEPYPSFEAVGKPLDWSNAWIRPDGDTLIVTQISRLSCNEDPRLHDNTFQNGFEPKLHFVEKIYEGTDSDGKKHETWEWWECFCTRFSLPETKDKEFGTMIGDNWEPENPEALILSYKAQQDWEYKYIHGAMSDAEYEALSPTLKKVLALNDPAKTQSLNSVKDGVAEITWSVKYFYPHRRAAFAARLGRMVKHMKQAGHKVRVY